VSAVLVSDMLDQSRKKMERERGSQGKAEATGTL